VFGNSQGVITNHAKSDPPAWDSLTVIANRLKQPGHHLNITSRNDRNDVARL